MEVRSVTNPGQAGGGGGASSTVQSNQNPPVPSVVTPNNHVSKIKQAPRRKRPGKVKTTLPIVKSKDQCDKHCDEVLQFSVEKKNFR